ncbi:MAG: hypothetical protein NTY01_21530 [Verrucomicrobia bacterium]|nr:hypothetical protein [Verrucomicrobiota bacterium]
MHATRHVVQWLAVACVLVSCSIADATAAPAKPVHPRIIYNDDGFNFLTLGDDLSVKDLRAYLSRLRGTQVDLVAYCVAEGGYVTLYESEIADPLGSGYATWDKVKLRRIAHNRERLRAEAGDYIGAVFSILREMKLPVVASIRMNDAHMSSDPKGPLAGQFWKKHPEWRLGAPYGYYASCLNYAVPEVRDYLRRLAREIITKFPDIAGIELDGLRSPFFFKPDEGRKNALLMTELIRQIRSDLDAAARAKGRDRYLLRVNVPRTPELALDWGMDVAAWDRDGLVDGVSPGCYNADFQPPVELWKKHLSGRVAVHAYINCSPATAMYLSLEQYRGAAANAYAAGADGVYLFNFPCLDELSSLLPRPANQPAVPPPDFRAQCWHSDFVQTRQALRELGDAAGLARKDKHYLFYMGPSPYRHYTQEVASIDRAAPKPAELSFRCYHAANAKKVTLKLKSVGVTTREQFSFSLNSQPIASERIQRLHAPGGRDARIHSIKLEPYSQFEFDLSRDMLHSGDNRLTVSLTDKESDLTGKIELLELELLLHN